jgi:DNA-binding transcriptional MerR regulator
VPGNALPDKLFFKIGEVAQIVGVRAHVLRYWESEFSALRPQKTRGRHRVYRRRDVELAVLLRRLLHEEGLTIAGARRRLRESGQHRIAEPSEPSVVHEVDHRAELIAMRGELTELLAALESAMRDDADGEAQPIQEAGSDADEGGSSSSVTVHARKRPVS